MVREQSIDPSEHVAGAAPRHVPRLESARLVLRPWKDSDVVAYERIVRDPEVMRHLGSGLLYKMKRAALDTIALVSDFEARRGIAVIRRHWERCGFGEWAVEEKASGRLIGQIGLKHHPDWLADPAKVEIGWMLARSAWGRGFATEGGRIALDHAFERLGLERIVSIANRENRRSQRVMQKLGLHRQGATRWHRSEVVWYAIDRAEWTGR